MKATTNAALVLLVFTFLPKWKEARRRGELARYRYVASASVDDLVFTHVGITERGPELGGFVRKLHDGADAIARTGRDAPERRELEILDRRQFACGHADPNFPRGPVPMSVLASYAITHRGPCPLCASLGVRFGAAVAVDLEQLGLKSADWRGFDLSDERPPDVFVSEVGDHMITLERKS